VESDTGGAEGPSGVMGIFGVSISEGSVQFNGDVVFSQSGGSLGILSEEVVKVHGSGGLGDVEVDGAPIVIGIIIAIGVFGPVEALLEVIELGEELGVGDGEG